MIYLAIFMSKILENTLATLRIIVVSNGKKKLGAILQGLVALIWIFVTGIVIVNVDKDILKIICFVIGSIVGSYLGSVLEEKIALGTNLLIINTTKQKEINKILKPFNPFLYKNYFLLKIRRKNAGKLIEKIINCDKNSTIFSERIKVNYDKSTN